MYPDVAGAHAFIIRNKLYVLLGSVFGSNVRPYNWEVIALSRTKLAEWIQIQPNIREIEDKNEDLLNLIQFPKHIFKPKDSFVQATLDSINTGVKENRIRLPTQNAIFVDDNLMANTWEHLKPTLAASLEALFILLGFPEETMRKGPLSIDKYYKNL